MLPEDVTDLAPDVLRHRLVAVLRGARRWADRRTHLIRRIMQHVPAPEKPLETHVRIDARTPEAVLRRLEWTVIRRLDGLLQGDYRTLFRGFGLDLADLREYVYHDDVRHIDWNVTARLQTPYVREFNEDREVTAWFLLDLSPSVDFGSRAAAEARSRDGVRRRARADAHAPRQPRRRAALRRARRHGDSGAQRPPSRAAPAASDAHPAARSPNRRRPNLRELLQTAYRVAPRRSLMFVVSDFISAPGWAEPLAHLAQRHDVVAVRLYDPLEMDLPDLGLLVVQDAETGEQLFVDTHDRDFASASRRPPRSGNRSCARRSAPPASTRSSSRPTTTWWTRSCASPTCASAAASSQRAPACRVICNRFIDDAGARHEARPERDAARRSAAAVRGRAHAVTFLWPEMLWLLLLVPVAAGVYVLVLRRKRKAGAALREPRAHQGRAWPPGSASAATFRRCCSRSRSHCSCVAIARPAAVVTLPSQHETVILAIDVSGSMRATDVKPNRIAAAQEAAKAFVAELPQNTRVGVVSFAATASVVQSPTHSREDIVAAIDRFQLQRGTAIGSGILVSLKMIFPDVDFDLRSYNPRGDARRSAPLDPSRRGRQGGTQASSAGLLRVGRDHPADRRPDDDRTRPDRGGAHGGRPRRARLHGRASAHRPARSSASMAGRCACASTKRR